MNRIAAFIKRNTLEMLRDPLIYVFCLGFPVVMLVLFKLISSFANDLPIFEASSLVPGIIMFSFTFVMLIESIMVSKDRSSSFLIRLYTSPMRTADYVVGYALPCFAVGIVQEIVCILSGWLLAVAFGGGYFSFGSAVLLALAMLPSLVFFIFLGILFGSILGDKAAPGVCSVVISAAGILGGAWMPLETMGGFETFCRILPFYPYVYIGRIITGANHVLPDASSGLPSVYAFDNVAKLGLIPIIVFMITVVSLSLFAFNRNMRSDKR